MIAGEQKTRDRGPVSSPDPTADRRLLQLRRRRLGRVRGMDRRGAGMDLPRRGTGWIRRGVGVGLDRACYRAASEIYLLFRAGAEIDQLRERGSETSGF